MEETPSTPPQPPPAAPSAPKDPPATSMTTAPPPATHKKRPFKVHAEDKTCPKCGKVLQSRLALRLHLNRVYPCDSENADGPKTWGKCGRTFTTPGGLSLHLARVIPCDAPGPKRTNEREYECEKCHDTFTSAQSLLAHRSRVYPCDDPTRKRAWQGGKTCPKCNKTFASKQSLRLHLNRVTPCDAEKPSASEAQDGEGSKPKTQAPETLHSCPDCPRRFTTKHGLHIHMSRCPVTTQPTKIQSAGGVGFRIVKQGEDRSKTTQVNVAISNNVSHGDATSVTDSSSCSSPSTEASVELSSTAAGVTSTSEPGNRKRNVDHGGEGLSPVDKSRKRACTDAGAFAKLVARLAKNGPSTTGNEKLMNNPTANEATKAKELLCKTNCNHGGDILTDGCCCRPCVRKWARKMTVRLGNLADEVENLRGMAKTDASGMRHSLAEGTLDATCTTRGASLAQDSTGDDNTKQETPDVMGISLDTASEQDPGKISLVENYNHVNSQIIINERALEDSMAYLDKTCEGDELNNLEMRDQIDELRMYLNVAKGKRDKAVAAIIAHRWSARRNEFRLLLEKMAVKSKPDAERVFHEECAEIADQLTEKDQAISELKVVDPTVSKDKLDTEVGAKALLERERDELFMRLLRSSRRIYLLAKETFVK